ncbi:MAG: sulfotransferase [Pirellulales bacterium]|nr:sulfotransferase [Pirellulales bacterium]
MEQREKQTAAHSGGSKDRPWELRIWSGIGVKGWFREIVKNRFNCGPTRIGMALILTALSLINSLLWLVQTALMGRKIDRTEIEKHPIFVLGHWRSGTTLLHELLVCDPRHTYPDTFACFAPNHFLLSAKLFSWWLWALLPRSRPMDDMRVGLDSPQEDEWAMCNMGVPSPYLTLMFPNHPPAYGEYLDLRNVSPSARARWKRELRWFLKCLTFRNPRRIVLKTPQHTCRIKTLLEMFPDARFVHIVRDPYTIFPSTIKLWKRMYRYHGLQKPRYEGLEEHVLKTFERMYEVFEEDRKLLGPSRFLEVHYEELVADPVGRMREIYQRLELGDFEVARPGIEAYAERTKDYKVNRHELADELRDRVGERWKTYIERYGYQRSAEREK